MWDASTTYQTKCTLSIAWLVIGHLHQTISFTMRSKYTIFITLFVLSNNPNYLPSFDKALI